MEVEVLGGPRDGEVLEIDGGAYMVVPLPRKFHENICFKEMIIQRKPNGKYYVLWDERD